MPHPGEGAPLLAYTHSLSRGPRVHLTLARSRDREGIASLLSGAGLKGAELDAARLVRFDPRERCVISATGLIDGRQRIVGVGAIALGAGEPELLVVDPRLTEGLDDLLRRALLARVKQASRSRTA